MPTFWNGHDDLQRPSETSFWTSCGYGLIRGINVAATVLFSRTIDGTIRVYRHSIIIIVDMVVDASFSEETANDRGPSMEDVPTEVAIVADCKLGSDVTVVRLTAGRRDAALGRLISATSLVATVGRLTTKVCREDDACFTPRKAG